MQGPLHEFGLSEVLQFLERGKRSGQLLLIGPDPTFPRTLQLRLGQVTAVEPDASDEATERALVSRALTAADATTAVPAGIRHSIRLELAERALAIMLGWTRGRFEFADGSPGDGTLTIRVDSLLRKEVEAEHRCQEYSRSLDGFRAIPDFPSESASDIDGTLPSLNSDDWRILDAVNGVRSVAAIADHLDLPLDRTAERILGLQSETILVLKSAAPDVAVSARAAVESGRYDDAVEQLALRLTAIPEDEEAWRLLGLAQVGAGRFEPAMEAWRSWRRLAGPRAAEADTLIQAAHTMLEAMRAHRD